MRHNAPVTLVQYSEQWPVHYEREAGRIRSALGGRVLLLEHVGSTSVPGLTAKPVIDICLGVSDPADEQAYVPALAVAGYVLRIHYADAKSDVVQDILARAATSGPGARRDEQ